MNNKWYSYRYNIRVFNKTRYYYSVSPAWRQVSKFYDYIQSSSIWSRSIEFWSNKKATTKERESAFLKYLYLVELGAVILMDFKFDGKIKYTHAALVVGVTLNDIKYAAHTSNRWRQSLWQKVKEGTIERYIIYNISKYAT